MEILYVDKVEPGDGFIKELNVLKDISVNYVKIGHNVLEYIENNRPVLIIIGSELEDSTGLELVNSINSKSSCKVPIIYIVDNEEDLLLDTYYSLGIRDCVLRSDLNIGRIDRHLSIERRIKNLNKELSSISIAVIDDSKVSLKAVSDILKEMNIDNFETFTSSKEVLKEYDRFSCFFVDIVMPELTGDRLIGILRTLNPDCIIIAMSAIGNVKMVSHVLNSGADDYIIKPFNPTEVRARLRSNFRSFSLLHQLKEKNRELDRLAKTDSLTGAYNHGFIVDSIKKAVDKSKERDDKLSLVMIDLDKFKEVNDTFGHAVGDNVLISLSDLILRKIRKNDIFGRYGGEEFMLLLPGTGLDEAVSIANSLSNVFSSMEIEGINRKVTFSGGVSTLKSDETYENFIARADSALYSAKDKGRDRIESDK